MRIPLTIKRFPPSALALLAVLLMGASSVRAAGPLYWDWPTGRSFAEMELQGAALDRDGFYVMRHTALLSTLDPDELVVPMHVLVKVADKLEEELTGADIW